MVRVKKYLNLLMSVGVPLCRFRIQYLNQVCFLTLFYRGSRGEVLGNRDFLNDGIVIATFEPVPSHEF